ncbi:cation transporting ATPase C-terminal domain-containing protein [Methanosarcina acetivorans]|uniref:cation transporting ATPase C-terminal domain-containing protein n=1 Tax=Methanosarcina acetivorans TaxID=2214 RepID=UPI0006910826|nr:cation transporting ATPase C-terminal domain-containing protein [Methanosarcina acetivorans]
MAQKKVIVKRLVSIENLGSMNMLRSDKTGTLTEGELQLHSFQDLEGKHSEKVLLYACLNAYYQKGFENPIDRVILAQNSFDLSAYRKLGEIPYDFVRKKLSVFDYLTFVTLLLLLPGMTEEFRTGWFIESVISASMIVMVIRSRKPFFRSKPGKYLLTITLLIGALTLVFPLTPLAAVFSFKPLPFSVVLIIEAIIGL